MCPACRVTVTWFRVHVCQAGGAAAAARSRAVPGRTAAVLCRVRSRTRAAPRGRHPTRLHRHRLLCNAACAHVPQKRPSSRPRCRRRRLLHPTRCRRRRRTRPWPSEHSICIRFVLRANTHVRVRCTGSADGCREGCDAPSCWRGAAQTLTNLLQLVEVSDRRCRSGSGRWASLALRRWVVSFRAPQCLRKVRRTRLRATVRSRGLAIVQPERGVATSQATAFC